MPSWKVISTKWMKLASQQYRRGNYPASAWKGIIKANMQKAKAEYRAAGGVPAATKARAKKPRKARGAGKSRKRGLNAADYERIAAQAQRRLGFTAEQYWGGARK